MSVPEDTPLATAPDKLDAPEMFVNRELSWLEFNARVVAEAADPSVPLFERLKFLAIFSTNLDEFFMVRAAGLQAQLSSEVEEVPPDGKPPEQQLEEISLRAHQLVTEQYRTFNQLVRPALRNEGIAVVHPDELKRADLEELDRHFDRNIFPVLTPIAIDPALFDILWALQRSAGGKALHLLCGYRSPTTNAMMSQRSRGVARNSFHVAGRAADIRIPDYSLRGLRNAAVDLALGGVGYYPRSNFVHVDTGEIRTW